MGGEQEFGLGVCLRHLWDTPVEAKQAADSLRLELRAGLGVLGVEGGSAGNAAVMGFMVTSPPLTWLTGKANEWKTTRRAKKGLQKGSGRRGNRGPKRAGGLLTVTLRVSNRAETDQLLGPWCPLLFLAHLPGCLPGLGLEAARGD